MSANSETVYPSCQVAGVGETDTVILDGCRSAVIHWDGFQPVAVERYDSWKRFFARMIVRSSPILSKYNLSSLEQSIGYELTIDSPHQRHHSRTKRQLQRPTP